MRRIGPSPRVEGSGELLDLVRTGRARTIGELAAAMDMARSTVAQRVDRLIAAGLVVSEPAVGVDVPSGRGRPPAVLRFDPGSGLVLVAHVGMTGARVAATDLDGSVLTEHFEPFLLGSGPEAVVEHLRAALTTVLAVTGRPRGDVQGIGIGMPAAVELVAAAGVPDSAAAAEAATSWHRFSVVDSLQVDFGVPVFEDNDVNLLAFGEQRACWPGTEVVLCVKAGSVIGCGTVVRGEVVTGAQGVAGGIGHLSVPGDTTPCPCGNAGCLDAVASGRVLVTRLRAAGFEVADVPGVARLARAGVPEAVQAVRFAGRCIGEVLAPAVNLLNPGVIAVWGYLADAEDQLLAGIREAVYQRSRPAATRSLRLVRAQLGDGLAGAATMVLSRILAPEALDDRLTRQAPAASRARSVPAPPRSALSAS